METILIRPAHELRINVNSILNILAWSAPTLFNVLRRQYLAILSPTLLALL